MDFEKIIDNLSPETKEKFEELTAHLEDGMAVDEEFEKDFAGLLLNIMSETQFEEGPIMRTSYLLANTFKKYSFDYRIERAIEIFNQLQIPLEFQEGKEFELWDKARDFLLKYLDGEEVEEESAEEELDLDFDADN